MMLFKSLRFVAASASLAVLLAAPLAAAVPEVTAATAVLIDGDTGQVLYDKNSNVLAHPASMTKVMTGLLAVELASPEEIAVVSEEAVKIPWDSSHEALAPGEEFPVDSLLYALMLRSANDAANTLAEHVAGSQAAFTDLMNQRAKAIGAVNTHFENAHGLTEETHLTTAYDMALITREAIQNESFLKYFGTGRYTIPATNFQPERPFTNQQYMLLPDQTLAYYPDAIGGKVGFTEAARHTMTTAARRGDRTLIAVVMGCGRDEKFVDTEVLFDYGFDEFVQAQVPLERLTFTTPVTEDGETVGEAIFSSVESAPVMYLPKDSSMASADYQYNIPDTVTKDSEPSAAVTVSVGGVSMEFPLTAEIQLDSAPVVAMTPAPGKEPSKTLPAFPTPWLLLLFLPPLAVFGWILYRREKIRRRAERRRQRQERILQERRRRYS